MKNHQNKPCQSLVEFAFVLPILLMLLIGIVDLGYLMYVQLVVTNAVWEGGRAGATIIHPENGDAEILEAVHQSLMFLNDNKVQIGIDPEQTESPRNLPWPEPRGSYLTVSVNYPVVLAFPPMKIPISSHISIMMEYQNP